MNRSTRDPHASNAPGWALSACALALTLSCSDSSPPSSEPASPPEAPPPTASAPLFTDVTLESGIDFVATSGRNPSTQILEIKSGGIALFDLEGDGDFDVFAPNGAYLDTPDAGPGARVFANLGGLRFENATQRARLKFQRWGMGVAVGDCDGDGSDDLFVACYGRDALLINQSGILTESGVSSGLRAEAWTTSASFGDLDVDGDLDLYVTNYLEFDPENPPDPTYFLGAKVFGGPIGLTPVPDKLYENLGDGTFRDISAPSGIASVAAAFGLGAVILDLNQDGQQDIFVGNDSMPNFLFEARGPLQFRNMASKRGVASNADGQNQATMGIAVADVDGNGLADLFTTNFTADTNTLHVGSASTRFRDKTQIFGLGLVSRPYLGWAAGFYDFDIDGDEDLIVFNGHVYSDEICEQLGHDRKQTPLFFQRASNRFERATVESVGAWLGEPHVDRGAAFGDLDSDGDVDVVVSELNGPLRVLRNESVEQDRGNWLSVFLSDQRPDVANRRALGARVTLTAGELVQRRWIYSGGSYQSASAPGAWFGLPDGDAELQLEVLWPDGTKSARSDLRANSIVTFDRE